MAKDMNMPPQTMDLSRNNRRKTLQTSQLDALRNACTRESDARLLVKLYTRLGRVCVRWLCG